MRGLLFALAFLNAAAAAAAPLARAGPLYRSPSKAWQGAIGPSAAGLPPLSYGPLVHHLETSLRLDPAAFSQLKHSEKLAALDLARDEAKAEVEQAALELSAAAEALSRPEAKLDYDGLEKLYWTVAQLDELGRYGPLLGQAAEAARSSYKKASSRAWQLRTELLERKAQKARKALEAGEDQAPFVPAANNNHFKLLRRMRNNSHNWTAAEVDALLSAWGFEHRNGSKHNVYTHPRFADLRLTLPRDRQAPAVYVDDAVALIDEIQRRMAGRPKPKPEGPPESIRPEDLQVLLSPKS